jgi:hypothetical protein
MSEKPSHDYVPLKMLFLQAEGIDYPASSLLTCLKSSSYLSQESERMKKTTFKHDSAICRTKVYFFNNKTKYLQVFK